jgi:hypothetical protein
MPYNYKYDDWLDITISVKELVVQDCDCEKTKVLVVNYQFHIIEDIRNNLFLQVNLSIPNDGNEYLLSDNTSEQEVIDWFFKITKDEELENLYAQIYNELQLYKDKQLNLKKLTEFPWNKN